MPFKAPYLPYERLREEAEAFLDKYHPGRTIPVPIDAIIERDFGMDIVPMPGLQEHFETVAFITHDLSDIRIDEFVFRERLNRYRFSLAHELAHRILHADVFKELDFHDIATWKMVETEGIPADQYSYIEFHADSFAGLVLVPSAELRATFARFVERAAAAGIDFADADQAARETIEYHVGRQFLVAAKTAQIRIRKDRLWEEFT